MGPLQVADKTWAIVREEGAVIEEVLEDDGDCSFPEKVDEIATLPTDAVIDPSFNEKSSDLHGHQADVVDISPDDHPTKDEEGQGLL
jgi:hypothetical protein